MTAVWMFLALAVVGTVGICVTRSNFWVAVWGTVALAAIVCTCSLWPLTT